MNVKHAALLLLAALALSSCATPSQQLGWLNDVPTIMAEQKQPTNVNTCGPFRRTQGLC